MNYKLNFANLTIPLKSQATLDYLTINTEKVFKLSDAEIHFPQYDFTDCKIPEDYIAKINPIPISTDRLFPDTAYKLLEKELQKFTISIFEPSLKSIQYDAEFGKINFAFNNSPHQIAISPQETYEHLINLKSNVSIENNRIVIPKDIICDIQSSDTIPCDFEEIPATSTSSEKISFSFKDFFLSYIFPFIIALIPIIDNHYLAEQEHIENERTSLQESIYHEKLFEIETERNETLQFIADYLQQISESLDDIEENQQPSDETDSQFHTDPPVSESSVPVDLIEL